MKTDQIHAYQIIVRTSREDSAFLYHILEAHEGLTAYSTLEFKEGDLHRDVVLIIPPNRVNEVRSLLADLVNFVTVLKD